MSLYLDGRVIDSYCPVGAEEYCEGLDVKCPWLLIKEDGSNRDEVDVSICPMMPQLNSLKQALKDSGVV